MAANSLSTYLMQVLKNAYPTLDWDLGSVLREWLIEPSSTVAAAVDGYVNDALSSVDVLAFINNPEQHEDAIKAYANAIGIQDPSPKRGTGTVIIIQEGSSDLLIPIGTVFAWGDFKVVATRTVTGTMNTSYIVSGDAKYTQLVSVSPGYYKVEIDVETTDGSSACLSSGTPVVWQTAPSSVYSITVGSAVSGGVTSYTTAELAQRIYYTLYPIGYTGDAMIAKMLLTAFPTEFNSLKTVKSASMASMYVKSLTQPSTVTLPCTFTTNSNGTFSTYLRSVPGYVDISSVIVGTTVQSTYTASESGTDTYPMLTVTIDSASEETELTGSVTLLRYALAVDIDSIVNGSMSALPFAYRIAAPTTAYITMHIPYTGTPSDMAALQTALQTQINSLSLDTAVIKDSMFTPTLASFGCSLSGNIFYELSLTNGSMYGSSGQIAVRDQTKPVAYYSSLDRINLNHV